MTPAWRPLYAIPITPVPTTGTDTSVPTALTPCARSHVLPRPHPTSARFAALPPLPQATPAPQALQDPHSPASDA